jgi:hypothetical protein
MTRFISIGFSKAGIGGEESKAIAASLIWPSIGREDFCFNLIQQGAKR